MRELFSMIGDDADVTLRSTIAVFYNFTREKVTLDNIMKMVKNSEDYVRNYFLVVGIVGKNGVGNVEKSAQSQINEWNRSQGPDSIHIEIFKDEDLMFNVLSHDLVPKHILLKEEEKAELLYK